MSDALMQLRGYISAVLLVATSNCSYSANLTYDPNSQSAEPAKARVAVRVTDDRPPAEGGADTTAIGHMRGEFGDPTVIHEESPQGVVRVIREATVDALKHARVAVAEGSSRVLIVSVREFWMEGYGGYKANIKADLDIQDENGRTLWSGVVIGQGGAFVGFGAINAGRRAPNVFQDALENYATNATQAFQLPDFQLNLR